MKKINTLGLRCNSNIIVIGKAGSGKTRGMVIPNIMEETASYIINDPCGEIYGGCGETLKKDGYKVIKVDALEADTLDASDFNAASIGILLGILAYEVTLFVNLRISCLLMPGLAALCVGGAGLFVVGWFSFLGYEFYLGNKKTEADKFSFENLDIYGKILWATTAVGLSMFVSTAFAPLFLIRK